MAAISDNKYDVFYWIEKIIYSCEDVMQVNISKRLVNNFNSTYQDKYLQNKFSTILLEKLANLMNKKEDEFN
jgi:hypothetical protein